VVVLQAIVEALLTAVDDVIAKGLADRTRIGIISSGRHSLWHVTDHIDSLRRSKRLVASMFRFSARHGINQIPIPIDGPREGAALSFDVHIGFIDVPGPACEPASLGTQLIGYERGKPGFPVPNGRVA
jgi:hypothetical protein